MTEENHNSKSMFHGFWALTNRDLKKWYKAPLLVLMSIIQPILWMGLFGRAMNIGAIFTNNPITLPTHLLQSLSPEQQIELGTFFAGLKDNIMTSTFGVNDYFSFMAVGMLSFVVVFTAMFSGMSIVWDRRLGFLNKALSTPVARGAIIMSKVLSAVTRSLIQAGIVVVLAWLFGMQFSPSFTVVHLLGAFAALFLMCLGLSSLFLAIAIRSTRWETQMAVVNLLNILHKPYNLRNRRCKTVANPSHNRHISTCHRLCLLRRIRIHFRDHRHSLVMEIPIKIKTASFFWG